jgi:hypothetical protein
MPQVDIRGSLNNTEALSDAWIPFHDNPIVHYEHCKTNSIYSRTYCRYARNTPTNNTAQANMADRFPSLDEFNDGAHIP